MADATRSKVAAYDSPKKVTTSPLPFLILASKKVTLALLVLVPADTIVR